MTLMITLRPHTYNGIAYVDGDTYEADDAYPDVIDTLLVMHFAARSSDSEPSEDAPAPTPPPPHPVVVPPVHPPPPPPPPPKAPPAPRKR
jgi:hypothetical protein